MLSGVLEEEDIERDLKSWALAIIESGAAESSANWIDFLISMTTLVKHNLAKKNKKSQILVFQIQIPRFFQKVPKGSKVNKQAPPINTAV